MNSRLDYFNYVEALVDSMKGVLNTKDREISYMSSIEDIQKYLDEFSTKLENSRQYLHKTRQAAKELANSVDNEVLASMIKTMRDASEFIEDNVKYQEQIITLGVSKQYVKEYTNFNELMKSL